MGNKSSSTPQNKKMGKALSGARDFEDKKLEDK